MNVLGFWSCGVIQRLDLAFVIATLVVYLGCHTALSLFGL